jgi:class 3 adenylate cyclase
LSDRAGMAAKVVARVARVANDLQIAFRIGTTSDDIIVEDDSIFGDGLNLATRPQAIARSEGILHVWPSS